MERISLIRFSFDRKALGIPLTKANKFYRTLYGYHSSSYYGKYHNWVAGFIEEIDAKKISSSTIMLPFDKLDILIKFLEENGAKVEIITDELFIEKERYQKIISMGKEVLTPK
jgi:hypothetical protein